MCFTPEPSFTIVKSPIEESGLRENRTIRLIERTEASLKWPTSSDSTRKYGDD